MLDSRNRALARFASRYTAGDETIAALGGEECTWARAEKPWQPAANERTLSSAGQAECDGFAERSPD